MSTAARRWRIAALSAIVAVAVVAAVVGVRFATDSAAPAAKPTSTPGQPGYDVVVILGQSNAQGAGFPGSPTLDRAVDGLDQLAGSGPNAGTIIPANDSLFQVTQWKSPSGTPRIGPGMQFGRDLLASETTGRHVLLVPAAEGDTSMTGDAKYSWDPADTSADTNLYTRALSQIDLALAQNPENRLAAIIWAQGESDAALTSGAVYQAKLLTVVDGLRAHYGPVPFLIGSMVPEWVQGVPERQAINTALETVASLRPDARFVAGVPNENQDGGLHYSAAGARAMGDRYFVAFEQLTL